jgi:hypothetical protein
LRQVGLEYDTRFRESLPAWSLTTNVLAISKVAAKLGCHNNPTRARARIVDYTLVLSARAMMLVIAATMESPVTTVSRIAANAAAAIVPMAYSTDRLYTFPLPTIGDF